MDWHCYSLVEAAYVHHLWWRKEAKLAIVFTYIFLFCPGGSRAPPVVADGSGPLFSPTFFPFSSPLSAFHPLREYSGS